MYMFSNIYFIDTRSYTDMWCANIVKPSLISIIVVRLSLLLLFMLVSRTSFLPMISLLISGKTWILNNKVDALRGG